MKNILAKRKRFIVIPLLTTVLTVMLITGCTDPSDRQESNQTVPSSAYSWIIEPKFDYQEVNYHPGRCGDNPSPEGRTFFASEDRNGQGYSWIINPATGEIIEEHFGHEGSDFHTLLYDTKTQTFFDSATLLTFRKSLAINWR
jgi:hypothetical protein